MVEIRANGQVVELLDDERIKYTKQANDLADVSSVNSSYTNTFKALKTNNNTSTFFGLGLIGNESATPYTKVNADLSENGLPILANGRLKVNETSNYYELSITEGIVDFFKIIENKKIGTDVDLSELNHDKTIANVINSLDNTTYRYLINDYGGKTIHRVIDLPLVNIDYLVPSANEKYLFDKIHSYAGYTYSGAFSELEDFTNSWITFPKSNSEVIEDRKVYAEDSSYRAKQVSIDEYGHEVGSAVIVNPTAYENKWESWSIQSQWFQKIPIGLNSFPHFRLESFKALQNGTFKVTFDFDAQITYKIKWRKYWWYSPYEIQSALKVVVLKNGVRIGESVGGGQDFTINIVEGDIIQFRFYTLKENELWEYNDLNSQYPISDFMLSSYDLGNSNVSNVKANIYKLDFGTTDFNENFKDFDIKTFLKEVFWRFGLTPIVDNVNNHITYYMESEIMNFNDENVIDLSSKYVNRVAERYNLGNYGQINYLRHKYVNSDDDYSDGIIYVNNENLADYTDLVTSKYYAPSQTETILEFIAQGQLSVYPTPIWSSEVKENNNGEMYIDYKSESGRYYRLKSVRSNNNVMFTSERFNQTQSTAGFNYASVYKTTFKDSVADYFAWQQRIFNRVKVHEINLSLNVVDFNQLDFTKIYYFKQENKFYKLNRIQYEPNKVSLAEFIVVNPR